MPAAAPGARRARGVSAGGVVYDGVREKILSGELPVGAWLVEAQLAEQFSVSRTPVREALRRLIDDRLVTHDPYRGAVVRAIDVQEATEVCEIHEVLDGLAARLAAQRADAVGLQQLADTMADMRGCLTKGDWSGAVAANVTFHSLIYGLAGSSRLQSMAEDLSRTMRRFSAGALADPRRAQQILAEHERCVETITSRDPDAAEQAAREHGRNCMSWTDSWLANGFRPSADNVSA
jgi:DNA-binding GntR family transcriptional regulator